MRVLLIAALFAAPLAAVVDLRTAVVIQPANATALEKKAAQVLVEEVEKRASIRWPILASAPQGRTAVVLGRAPAGGAADGYSIASSGARVEITGNDSRGLLYGVGRLLRELRMTYDAVELSDPFNVSAAPALKLRGHQLGYRPKTNSYDGWTVAMWETYIRELALWGNNAIELIPPRSDDAADSPHFTLPQMRMMVEMTRIIQSYGLEVWVWYPALDKDYTDPKTVEFALNEWAEVLRQLPQVDAIFAPGGDPGRTPPKPLFNLLEKQAASLRRFHPKLQIWVSPQGFEKEWRDEFYGLLKAEPAWLAGIVHGPQVRGSIEDLRKLVPARYPIREYPDITHSTHCQFPVPGWDIVHAMTHAREPINPRPSDMKAIFRAFTPGTIGFITYSEGCNDDVNKILWSALAWEPDADPAEILRQYARFFVGPEVERILAGGLAGLEANWRGPISTNGSIGPTLSLFQRIEKEAPPRLLTNWRLQMAMYRAYYDAYNQKRWIAESGAESKAMEALKYATDLGSLAAMAQAERALALPEPEETPSAGLRLRVYQLAEALFQTVRMQTSVPLYKAISRDRGATLDNIDVPLNNRGWLEKQFGRIREMEMESDRLKAIARIVWWEDAGRGGFYDDLGNPDKQPHLVQPASFADDPGFLRSPFTGFARGQQVINQWRRSSANGAETFYDTPVEMRYKGLDPAARYRIRVVYGGEQGPLRTIGLTANGTIEIHPPRKIEKLDEPLEFDIPVEATRSGELALRWSKPAGLGGNGRGCHVAEVWLMKAQ